MSELIEARSSDVEQDFAGDDSKRIVTLRRDGEDFVVAFYPDDIVVFRNTDAQALVKMCSFLRWRIVGNMALEEMASSDSEVFENSPLVPAL
jgi:hypothetical protein